MGTPALHTLQTSELVLKNHGKERRMKVGALEMETGNGKERAGVCALIFVDAELSLDVDVGFRCAAAM